MNEPSVLDYLKAKLKFWRKTELRIPAYPESGEPHELDDYLDTVSLASDGGVSIDLEISKPTPVARRFPWKTLIAFSLALVAQSLLEPSMQHKDASLLLYLVGIGFMIWSAITQEWKIEEDDKSILEDETNNSIRWQPLVAGAIFSAVTVLAFSNDTFGFLNIAFWLAALVCVVAGFINTILFKAKFSNLMQAIKNGTWQVNITWGTLLVMLVAIIIIFFRVYQLNMVPPEMTSDHAEKLQDVQDVLDGQWHVFFTRNTGREAFQFYWTALVIKIFNTGISFLSLKIGMVLAGLLTLPYIYLLGKEFFNKRIGLLALIFVGIAFWPNIISRVGLRFPLYPLFTAPALYYLLRGLKRGTRNDFIWCGIALGFGLHGYSPYRVVPILAMVIVMLYVIHLRKPRLQENALTGLTVTGITAVIVALPLIRYAVAHPDVFNYRFATRVSGLERELPGSPLAIFFDNLKNAMLMFGVSDGSTWLHSIPFRPALDVISAALFYLGFAFLLYRYIRFRKWLDLSLLISVPFLMLPSILSLAFPEENPALNRTAGAIIPVFLIIAICLDGILSAIERTFHGKTGKVTALLAAVVLVFFSARQNYNLVFDDYLRIYREAAGNTSEMGQVIRGFIDSVGSADSAWVVGYPYWVDTRLVSIQADVPLRDYAIWPQDFVSTQNVPPPKLFIINTEDKEDLTILQTMYPSAVVSTYTSNIPGRDFLVMLVPSE